MNRYEALTGRATGRRLSRRRALGVGAAAAGAIALLGACGSKGKGQSSTLRSSAAGQPKSGGQLTVRELSDPFDWDLSYVGRSIPNSDGLGWAYESLLTFKTGPDLKYDQLVLQPRLAEKWETPDGQTYTYHLRNGLKFANLPPLNGRDLTSADVQWSYEYWTRTGPFKDKKLPPAEYASLFEGINSIETPDPSTLVLHFQAPFAPFLNYSASPYIPIVPHEIYDQDGNLQKRVVGSGPWQLDEASSQKGTRWVWKKNPAYWDAPRPYLDQITWLIIPDDAAGIAAFKAKQLDILGGPTQSFPPDIAQTLGSDVVPYEYVDTAPQHLYMNVRTAPLNDLRIRQAISLSLDRDEFIKTMTNGKGTWALAGAQSDTYTQQEIRQMMKYDPAQAKQLVAAAGYPNGVDIEFIYTADKGSGYVTEIQLFQSQMKKGGVNVTLKALDKNDESTRKKKGDFQLDISTKALSEDVDSYLYAIFYPNSPQNYAGVNDPQLSDLLVAQRREVDATKRRDIVRQAVKRINVDEVWALALYYASNQQFWQPRLKNYAPHAGTTGWPLIGSWVEG